MEFYAWEFGNVEKMLSGRKGVSSLRETKEVGLVPLNCIYSLPVERVKAIDYSRDGRLFFFDELGALHEVAPQEENRLIVCRTGKYRIKNFINSTHNTF
jgi:hypothetical protein